MAFRISAASGLLFGIALQGAQADTRFFTTDADPFLGRVVASRECILADIDTALKNSSLKDDGVEFGDVGRVEDLLRPTFHALPKNKYDRLSSAGVRYLLHRHFLHQYAWQVKGLAPDGQAWDAHFPMQTVATWAPEGLQTVVADHLNGRGLTLRESAVLATMLENQVHAEAIEILDAVWRAHGLGPQNTTKFADMTAVIEDCIIVYLAVKEANLPIISSTLGNARELLPDYPGWPRTQQMILSMQQSVTGGMTTEALGFAVGEQILMRVMQQWGVSQDEECREMKRNLLKLERSRPGRVDLTVFHASHSKDQDFVETADYLRELGVLDETVPSRPEVIIPNYLHSPANYIASGDLFDVVCIDECEDLLSHIEKRLGAPAGTPEELADVVRSLPSSSAEWVDVTELLMLQLQQVAALHGGRVPLHGRLFALWMHHAYSNDCQYPARAGVAKPILPKDFQSSTGLQPWETDMELAQDVKQLQRRRQSKEARRVEPLPWDLQEEVFQEPIPDGSAWRFSSLFAVIAGMMTATTVVVRMSSVGPTSAGSVLV